MSTNLNTQLNVADQEALDRCSSSQRSSRPEANVDASYEINTNPSMNGEIRPITIEYCYEVYPVLLTALLDPINEPQPRSTNLCNVPELNLQPNLVNINSLTRNKQTFKIKKDVNISEKDDEIISVKESKQVEESEEFKGATSKGRRNPPRIMKSTQDILKKDHLMEEDFGLLDQLAQMNLIKGKDTEVTVDLAKIENSKGKRPCHMTGQKIKPFEDITNDFPKMPAENKQKRAPCTKTKKPIKKCAAKKRGRPAKKIPASDLIDLVSTTFQMVSNYVKDNKGKLQGRSKNDINALVRNQASLLAYVKSDYDRKKVTASVKDVLNQK